LPGTRKSSFDTRVRRALLNWFGRKARSLPWRKNHSAYAIWVSEIMLQQTQVATVIPCYKRFLRVFPSVTALARAPLERVLEIWSGLGYYRRARNLHQAAREIVERFSGRFPHDFRQARSLPGVGDYTARAVLSIAYNLPLAVLDGNVARVLARLRAYHGNLGQPRFRQQVERDLEGLLSRRRPGDFNQALMELGQTICLLRGPRCSACPLCRHCAARRMGRPESFPEPRPRRANEFHHLATAIVSCRSRVALVKGLDDGLLADMWNFPAAFGPSPEAALEALREKLRRISGGEIQLSKSVDTLRHTITHRSILVHVYPGQLSSGETKSCFRWLLLAGVERAAVSQLARKIALRLERRPDRPPA